MLKLEMQQQMVKNGFARSSLRDFLNQPNIFGWAKKQRLVVRFKFADR